MEALAQDLRYALRQLRRGPGFAAVAVATLALGIGANTAMFSLVRGVLLRPLPYSDAGRLVMTGASLPDYEDLRAAVSCFDETAVWASNRFLLGPDAGAGGAELGSEQVLGGVVSDRFFRLLGQAVLGRALVEEDRRREVVVLSHRLWVRRFASDTAVLGRTIRLYGKPYTIVGVVGPEFQFPSGEFELWVPLESALAGTPEQARNRTLRIFRVLAHLRPGVTRAQAQAEVDTVAARLAREHPDTNTDVPFELVSAYDHLVGDVRTPLLVLMGVVALVLLIACANVANLLLVRAKSREREIVMRTALGVGRARLVRQLLTESVVLALAGSVSGLVIAAWILDVLPAVAPFEIPRYASVRLDPWTLAFTGAVALATGVLFGLAPAWQACRIDLVAGLRDGFRGTAGAAGRRLRAVLTGAEVAVALVVLVAAGLLVQSLARLLRVDAGFVAENLLTFNVVLVKDGPRSADQRAQMAEEVMAGLKRLPGVAWAGAGTGLPPVTPQRVSGYAVDGPQPRGDSRAYFMAVTPDYFAALGAPIVEGRPFGADDRTGMPEVIILGRTLARRLYGDQPAVGRRIRLVNPEYGDGWRTVVGVVGDVRYTGLAEQAGDALYTPFAQTPFLWIYGMVRTTGSPETVVPAIQKTVASVDPSLAAAAIRPMEQLLATSVAQPRFNGILLSAFAVLALVLAVLGVYGLISYSVAQRVREIGVRMALGAGRVDVVRLVAGEGVRLAAAGIAAGVATAVAATRLLSSLLFEVRPLDAPTFAAAVALLGLVAVAASAVPALRASRVSPSAALRSE